MKITEINDLESVEMRKKNPSTVTRVMTECSKLTMNMINLMNLNVKMSKNY